MKHALLVGSVLFFAAFAFTGAVDLNAYLLHAPTRQLLEKLSSHPLDRAETQVLFKQGEVNAGGTAADHFTRAKIFETRAEQARTVEERIKLSCTALSSVGQALEIQPENPRYLLSWASLRQLLGSVECNQPFTAGSFRNTVMFLLDTHPQDTDVMFAAGTMFAWSGEKLKALDMYHKVLEYSVNLSERQQRMILPLIQNAEDLRRVLPARFPQIREWTARIQENDPELAERLKKPLGDLIVSAIQQSNRDLDSGSIVSQVHCERLAGLNQFRLDSDARRALDTERILCVERAHQDELAQYLKERGTYVELEIVRSTIASDSRPLKSPFVGWERGDAVFFDEFHQSVGFFLAPDQGLKIIELVGQGERRDIPAQYVHLYVSNDNQSWREVTEGLSVSKLNDSGATMLALRIKGIQSSYWKVHFSNSARTRSFKNDLDSMIRVYGNTSRGARLREAHG